MAKSKKQTGWHVDHGTWSFSADKYNPPQLTIDFTKPQGLKEKGETGRKHYLGALRFLENRGFNSDARNGNRFETMPLKEGHEVITLIGVENIRHLANALKKREGNDVAAANLAKIPKRFGGTGVNIEGDAWRPEREPAAKAEGGFVLDGNAPAAAPASSGLTEAQLAAIRRKQERAAQLKEQLEVELRKERPPAARQEMLESFIRRGLSAKAVAEIVEDMRQQPELTPAAEPSWAERVRGDALRMPVEPVAAPYKRGEVAAAAVEAITVPTPKILPPTDELRERVGLGAAKEPEPFTLTGDDDAKKATALAARKRATGVRAKARKAGDTLSGDFWAETVIAPGDDKTPGKVR